MLHTKQGIESIRPTKREIYPVKMDGKAVIEIRENFFFFMKMIAKEKGLKVKNKVNECRN